MNSINRTLQPGNGFLARTLRLAGQSPRLIARGLRYRGKKEFFNKLVNTYYSNYINLYLVFRPRYSDLRMRWIAARAVGTYVRNLVLYNAPRSWRGYDLYNAEALEDALSDGKGVVVAGQHLGPQRFSFAQIADRCGSTYGAMTEQFIDICQRWVDLANHDLPAGPQLDAINSVELLAVEKPTCALTMVRALKRNQAVMFDLDGNIGVGGESKTLEGATTLPFLGRQVHVRGGVAYLAFRTGAPILGIIPLWGRHGRPELHFLPPIRKQEGEDLETFTRRALTDLFGELETVLRERPEQWEMWPHFFKWLTPPEKLAQTTDAEALEAQVEGLRQALAQTPELGLRVKPEHAFVLRIRGKHVLVDSLNFRFFMSPASTGETLELLHSGTTIGRLMQRLERTFSRDAVLQELARLRMLDLLEQAPMAAVS